MSPRYSEAVRRDAAPAAFRGACLFLLALVVLAYANGLTNGFTQDDDYFIVGNEQLRHAPWRLFYQPHPDSRVYRPITFASFALNYAIGGPRPLDYHLVNLLLHGLVTVLLYGLLCELLHRPRVALAAATLFAVHPIHTEAVTSAVGRAELLAAAGLLGAWRLHLRERWSLAALCALLAMLAKESAIAVVALLPLADYACRRPGFPRRMVAGYARYAGVAVLYLVALSQTQGFARPRIPFIDNPLAALPAGWRALNALGVAWRYVALQLFPATLSSDYSYAAIPVASELPRLAPALAGWLVVAGLWLWGLRRGRTGPALAGTIYLAGFAISANVVAPIGTIMAERLAYWPSVGVCLLAALVWDRCTARSVPLGVALLALVTAALAARTAVRNRDWHDDRTLFEATVRAVPTSAKARQNLGVVYLNAHALPRAEEEFEAALRIQPDYPDALAGLGWAYVQSGDLGRAEPFLEKAFGTSGPENPRYGTIGAVYAALLLNTGRPDAALDVLNRVLAVSPRAAHAYFLRAVVRARSGNRDAALDDVETALRLDPTNAQAVTLRDQLRAAASP